MKRIEIVVDAQGNSEVQTKGFAGSDCVVASRFLENALGKQISQRTTGEFYAQNTTLSQSAKESS